jgi:hypothetical protein
MNTFIRTHPNGVTTVVNVADETLLGDHCPQKVDCYGKILLKGKLIPRQRRMKRKSKQMILVENCLEPSSNSNPLCPCPCSSSTSSTFLFNAPPLPSSTLRQGNSFDTSESEKIPIIGTIGSIDIDAGQVLQFGEVCLIFPSHPSYDPSSWHVGTVGVVYFAASDLFSAPHTIAFSST